MTDNQYDIGRRGCACGGLCEVEVALTIRKLTGTGRRTGTSKYRDACASKNHDKLKKLCNAISVCLNLHAVKV